MKALICGVSGQDGAYLAKFLLSKGYQVYGASRNAQSSSFHNLNKLGIQDRVSLVSVTLTDFRSVLQALAKFQPDEVYNLAGQSSVGLSFEQPVETMESIVIATLNLLEAIRFTGQKIKLYHAGSSECFGNIGFQAADELTPFRPRSPYAVAKSAAHWEVANYREAYNLFACTGILFNHESPLRPKHFVTRKIVSSACRIATGSQEKLHLGNITVMRDWGWAPEYVEAMWKLLQQQQPDDFVIATGESHTLEEFINATFTVLELNWRDYVIIDNELYRLTDISISKANPQKAAKKLGWKAKFMMKDVVKMMVDTEIKVAKNCKV
ncbi:NAD-dependent dehydratase [Achromatium sp. WMS3]|nr:NAD-dependent dehydratase [Achromatium sp. WMS3]